jgi:hypothetical protein
MADGNKRSSAFQFAGRLTIRNLSALRIFYPDNIAPLFIPGYNSFFALFWSYAMKDSSAPVLALAFAETEHCIASGELLEVTLEVKTALEADPHAQILVFDQVTSELIDLDLRGSVQEIAKRLQSARHAAPLAFRDDSDTLSTSRGRGRPKLGVVAREVTLLPRHWEWLNAQPGGASVALRKLVEEVSRDSKGTDRIRQSRESAYRFMSAIAGHRPNFEEATRALFATDQERFRQLTATWPADVRQHLHRLSAAAFPPSTTGQT